LYVLAYSQTRSPLIGNYPCANLHFGKSGYGSSIEIGNNNEKNFHITQSCDNTHTHIYTPFLFLINLLSLPGDVQNLQRLAVVARMVSICCFFPLLALFLGTGSFIWGMVLVLTSVFLCCFGCGSRLSEYDRFARLRPVRVMIDMFNLILLVCMYVLFARISYDLICIYMYMYSLNILCTDCKTIGSISR
jgi:hypothetical protein